MAHFPEWLPKEEAAVINPFLTRVLRAGHYIAVHDGEEVSLQPTRDRKAIQKETAATDMTNFIICDESKVEGKKWKRIGTVVAIHGNLEDVLSDASARDNERLDYIESLAWPE